MKYESLRRLAGIIMSNITDAVCEDLKARSEAGLAKYRTTMDRQDLTRKQWLQHLYEELLDAAQYTKKLIMECE